MIPNATLVDKFGRKLPFYVNANEIIFDISSMTKVPDFSFFIIDSIESMTSDFTYINEAKPGMVFVLSKGKSFFISLEEAQTLIGQNFNNAIDVLTVDNSGVEYGSNTNSVAAQDESNIHRLAVVNYDQVDLHNSPIVSPGENSVTKYKNPPNDPDLPAKRIF